MSQPVRFDEMEDIENLCLRYQAEFLPNYFGVGFM